MIAAGRALWGLQEFNLRVLRSFAVQPARLAHAPTHVKFL